MKLNPLLFLEYLLVFFLHVYLACLWSSFIYDPNKKSFQNYVYAIQQLQARKTPHAQTMGAFLVSAALDVFRTLIMDLDREGRYLFLNAIANQLRYPNNHTHYFSSVLLYLFAESNQVRIVWFPLLTLFRNFS